MQSKATENFDEMWSAPNAQTDAFVMLSRLTTFVSGFGLPGRMWASGKTQNNNHASL
jgi:hypothetical protein